MSRDLVFRISSGIQNSVASVKLPSTNLTTLSTAVTGIEVLTSVENSSDDDGGDDGSNDYITYNNGTTTKRTAIKSCGAMPRRLSFSQNGSQEDIFSSTSETKENKDAVDDSINSTTGRVQTVKQKGISITRGSETPQVSQTTK